MKLEKFTGINNVATPEKMALTDLREATNCEIGLARELRRREGYVQTSATAHRHLWAGPTFDLAVKGSDLVRVDTGAVLHASVGTARMWYVNLPDGRVAYSNGTVNGITNGTSHTTWGVPIPTGTGTPSDVSGNLFAGDYQISVTHVRTADGVEGGPLYRAPFTVAQGGISITGLPTLAGHKTNIYLTNPNGATPWLAGSTTGSTFSYTGKSNALQDFCKTDFCKPAPVGTILAHWRGRALVAVGNVLFPSRHGSPELFDVRREFKKFSGTITLVQPVAAGIFVGTTDELCFLPGDKWESLGYVRRFAGATLKGSGVTIPGEHLARADGTAGPGDCMLGIVGRVLVAGYQDGAAAALTEGRYQAASTITEVYASFRLAHDRVPLYTAIPQ